MPGNLKPLKVLARIAVGRPLVKEASSKAY